MTGTDPSAAPPGRPRRPPLAPRPPRSRRRRITYWAVGTVVVLWAGVVVIFLAVGLRDASHAMAQVTAIKSNLSAADLVSNDPGPQLTAAGAGFARAKSLLDSPVMAPL